MTVQLHRRLGAPTSTRSRGSNQNLRPCRDVPAANPFREVGGTSGFSLVEMIVAAAVFAIAATVAFVLYSDAARSYRAGGQLIFEQQNVRTGFDRMMSEIRMAGFNSNPGGDPARPDEQIEGAWDTAIAFRINLDSDHLAKSTVTELAIAKPDTRAVSIGDTKIVIYVLGKPEHQSRETLSFQLDASKLGSKTPRTVIIPDISLIQSRPPYVLYRITPRDTITNAAAHSQPTSDFASEPIADSIRSLRFQYYNHEGRSLSPNTPADLSDDIGGDDSGILTRSQIRSIRITLTGMVANEPAALSQVETREVPQSLSLSSIVTPENLGKIGISDSTPTTPPAPENVRAVAGHCRGALVTWEDDQPSTDIRGFDIRYWQKGSTSTTSIKRVPYPSLLPSGVDPHQHGFLQGLTDGVTYCFQVSILDASGNSSPWSSLSTAPCVQVNDASTPRSPGSFSASGGTPHSALNGEIDLQWSEVTTNTSILPGDPDLIDKTTVIRDLQGYKIYRDSKADFIPSNQTNLIATLTNGRTHHVDHNAANCKTYFYRIVAVDGCGVTSSPSQPAEGRAETSVPPSSPDKLEARHASREQNRLSWEPVRSDIDGRNIHVDRYNIYRYGSLLSLSATALNTALFSLIGSVADGATSYLESLSQPDQSDLLRGGHFYYAITAADVCGNESARSLPVPLSCQSNASVDGTPLNGDVASGIVPLVLRPATTAHYVEARAQIVRVDHPDLVVYAQESDEVPFRFPAWDARTSAPGQYRVNWELVGPDRCTGYAESEFTLKPRGPVGLATTTASAISTDDARKLSWDLINTTGRDLEIKRLDVTWFTSLGNAGLSAIELPSGRTVSKLPRGGPQSVSEDFESTPLRVPGEASGLCSDSSCRVSMSLVWDAPVLSSRSGSTERVTVRYFYADESGRMRSTALVVWPDLSIRMDRPMGFSATE